MGKSYCSKAVHSRRRSCQAIVVAKEIVENRRNHFGILPVRITPKSVHVERFCLRELVFKRQLVTRIEQRILATSTVATADARLEVMLCISPAQTFYRIEGVAIHSTNIGFDIDKRTALVALFT